MDIYSPIGSKVKFVGQHGSNEDLFKAHRILHVGCEYTITNIDVGSWVTYVYLDGYVERFNSVMFENV